MTGLPQGTVTLCFADVEGSTRLLERGADLYPSFLRGFRTAVAEAVDARDGVVVDTHGDEVLTAFRDPDAAVCAAVELQRRLHDGPWPDGVALRARVGVHTGTPTIVDAGYVGIDVHRAARVCAAAHGGQIVVSDDTAALLGPTTPGVELRDLGVHRLRGVERPERLHQVTAEDLPATFPALRTPPVRLRLPEPATGFVGRTRELAEVAALVEAADVRLLTLTGPGGVGKTRLAVRTAADVADRFAEVHFVALSEVGRTDEVVQAVGRTLGVPGEEEDVAAAVRRHLAERAVLLVVDNFEHVLPAGPVVAGFVADPGPSTVLVTSRTALGVACERRYRLGQLSLPASSGSTDVADSEAVTLFVERARAVVGDFALTPDTAPAVAAVCARVDGLPLAIELAAPRLRVLDIADLAERLERRLPLLTGGPADAPARHRTLRDTIAWSYELLTTDEQRLLRALGVFVDGFTVPAVEAVVEEDTGPPDAGLLDGLAALVDASLLWRDDRDGGHGRLRMLETIREFVRAETDRQGETPPLSRRHAAHYLEVALEARRALDTDAQLDALATLDREHGNVTAALAWLLDGSVDDGADALRLVDAMGWYWYTRGEVRTGATWLERTLVAAAGAPACLRAKPCYWLGACCDRQGDLPRARAMMERSVALLRGGDDDGALANALNGLATVAEDQGDFVAAEEGYRSARRLHAAAANDWGVATVEMGLGNVALHRGDVAGAQRLLERALATLTAEGDLWSEAVTRLFLARVHVTGQRPADAVAQLDRAAARLEEWGERGYLADCLDVHACVAAAERQALRAGRLAGAADAVRRATGHQLHPPVRRWLDERLASVRTHDAAAFAEGAAQGRHMTLEQALDHARAGAVPPSTGDGGAVGVADGPADVPDDVAAPSVAAGRVTQLLASVPLFAGLDEREFENLATATTTQRHRAGDYVVLQGEPGRSLFVVVDGRVRVVLTSPHGDEAILSTLGPGEVFGELAVIDRAPRSASVVTAEATELLVVDRRDLLALLGRRPAMLRQVLAHLGGLVRRLSDQVGDLTFLDLAQRVAKLIVQRVEATDDATIGDGSAAESIGAATVDLGMTQSELAAMVGGSRQSVNQILARFEQRGLLTRDGPRLTVTDLPALRRRAAG